MAHASESWKTAFTVQYIEHLPPVQESEVLVVAMEAYNLVLGLPWFESGNPDLDWQRGRLLALGTPSGAEVVAVSWVDHQESPGNVPESTAREDACSERGGGIPDIEILRATAFDDLLANEQVVGTFFLGVGDCTVLLGATVEGITHGEWDRPQALDGWAGSSSGHCGRAVSRTEPWMTATGMPRGEGRTAWRALPLLWRTFSNLSSWIFVLTAPYRLWMENQRVQMQLAERQRGCLQIVEEISRPHTENLWRFSAKIRRRHSHHIGQLTMQLTWSPAITCHIGGFATYWSLSWEPYRLTSRQT